MACDALLEGEAGTANAVVDAAGIRTPSGTLSICYDERGAECVREGVWFAVVVCVSSRIFAGL